MKIFLGLAFYLFFGNATYATTSPILKCWDFPDKYHPKLTITQNSNFYEFELVSLPDVQGITEQLFPESNNSFAERLIIKFKKCHFKQSRKSVVTCIDPAEISYYDWNGLLMNQVLVEDSSKLSIASSSYKIEESLNGKVDWISFEIDLHHKNSRAKWDINFYSVPLCEIN